MSTIPTPYFAILTTVGIAKLAKAVAQGTTVSLTKMGVGDGEGPEGTPIPSPDQKKLLHECRRAPINTLTIDPNSTYQIIAEHIIPASEGGWWIRELGLYDEDGDLCAVANCAPSYKPKLEEGSGREMVIRMILALSNTKAVKLLIDPGVVLATRKQVEDAVHGLIDTLHTDYAPLKNPTLQGAPTAPTPSEEDSSTRIATTAFVQGHAFSHAQWRIFKEDGTFTVPEGVHRIWISACAGGGGGGGGGSTGNQDTRGYGGGGGGGGGAGESVLYARHDVKPNDTLPIVLGAGGKGGAALVFINEKADAQSTMASYGMPGGDTHIGNLLHLKGGQGGGAGGAINNQAGAGGAGGQGWPVGSPGSDGAFAGNGGPGASSPFGGGGGAGRGSTVTHAVQNGAPGAGYGSGGGGAGGAYQFTSRRGGEGGSGAPGFVRIEW